MIYVFEGNEQLASIVYDEKNLSDELKAEGIAAETLPQPNTPAGKVAILKADKATNQIWYDYVDETPTPEDEISGLKQNQMLMQAAIDDLILGGTI